VRRCKHLLSRKANIDCKVFKLAEEACPCVYAIVDPEDEQDLLNALAGQKLVLVALSGITWEDELSPWPAAKSFPGGKDFQGGADAFIHLIETKIMPQVDKGLVVKTYKLQCLIKCSVKCYASKSARAR
jgi:hypothetical protein